MSQVDYSPELSISLSKPTPVVSMRLPTAGSIVNFKNKSISYNEKILIVIFCFALITKATAQPDKVILDNVFQNVNKATLPTGYLQDYGVAFVNKKGYNDSFTINGANHNSCLPDENQILYGFQPWS